MNSKRLLHNLVFGLTLAFFFFVRVEAKSVARDPTRPPTYRGVVSSDSLNREFEITAIFFGEESKAVIIENFIFVEGDEISGYTITAINKNSVKLKNESGEFEFVMPYSEVKTVINKKENSEK